MVFTTVVLLEIMNLGMAVVARCDAVGRIGLLYLLELALAIIAAGFRKA